MKTRSVIAALAALCCVLMSAPEWALAAEIRSGPTPMVASGETVDDDLFTGGGRTATISGHVTGDAYAVAETVVVNGSVDGDLIAAAQQVIVDGTIGGNVRAAGATVTINGTVGRNVTAAAQHVNLTSNGRIGGSVVAFGQSVDAFAPVGRGMTIGGGTLQLESSVGGPVLARVDTLSVAPSAHLAGTLSYQAKQEANVPAGAVLGAVQFTPTPQKAPQPAPLLNGLFDLSALIGLVGSFLIGALAIMLMPRTAARAAELGRQEPWQSFGIGVVVLLAVPLAALVVAVTLVGIPVALGVLTLYFLGILLAWPATALVLGNQLTRLIGTDQALPVLGTLALGLIVLHLVSHLPFVGPLVIACTIIYGLGLVAQALRRWRRPSEQTHEPLPVAVAA